MSGHDRLILGRTAKNAAMATLIANHQQEWDDLYAKARVNVGLPATPTPKKKKSRLEVLREQLRAQGIMPEV